MSKSTVEHRKEPSTDSIRRNLMLGLECFAPANRPRNSDFDCSGFCSDPTSKEVKIERILLMSIEIVDYRFSEARSRAYDRSNFLMFRMKGVIGQ